MEFRARWSKLLIGVSLVATAILGGASYILLSQARLADPWGPFGGAAALSTAVVAALYSVRGYRLEGRELFVKRLIWETRLDLAGLRSAEADPGLVRGSVRVFGNGGLYSFSGLFWNRTLGRYRAWVTHHDDIVVLRFEDRVWVVSPVDPAGFAAAALSHAQGGP